MKRGFQLGPTRIYWDDDTFSLWENYTIHLYPDPVPETNIENGDHVQTYGYYRYDQKVSSSFLPGMESTSQSVPIKSGFDSP